MKQYEDILAEIFKEADHGVIFIDSDQKIVFCNDWIFRHSSLGREEAIGGTFSDVFKLKSSSRLGKAVTSAISGGGASLLSHSFQPHPLPLTKGSSTELMIQRIAVRGIQFPDIPRCCLVEITDMTAAVERASYLNKAKKHIDKILLATPDLLFVLASDGTIDRVNFEVSVALGYSEDELLGKPFSLVLDHGEQLKVTDWVLSEQKKEATFAKDLEVRMKDKNNAKLLTLLTGISIEGMKAKEKQILIVAKDITKWRENEDLIKEQQAQLVTSTRLSSLGEMAGGIAHEINNPLAIIVGFASRLKKLTSTEEVNREKVRHLADKVEITAHRIAKIVRGLKSISRDGAKDPFETFDLQIMIEDVLSLTAEQCSQREIELLISAPASKLEIDCRAVELSQVLVNLVNNARDAVEELEEKWIKIELVENTDTVEIHVSDSGRGIPMEIQEKIFMPFFTTKAVGKGTGLGLSISNRIIESHNGRFEIKNNEPNTYFVITLPKSQEKEFQISEAA